MEFQITIDDYQTFVEYRMSEIVEIKCGNLPQEVSLPLAHKFVSALQSFLDEPDTIRRVGPTYMPFLRPPTVSDFNTGIDFSPERNSVSVGLWHLECLAPKTFYWVMAIPQPARIIFKANLLYLDDEKKWIVSDLNTTRVRPKR